MLTETVLRVEQIESMSKAPTATMDLEDRDPNSLSQHLQVGWSDVVGEPDEIRSPECAWSVSHQCFRITKNCCYICLSVICAPITAFCLGITFACLSFEHIWCIIPCLRVWKINCAATRSFVGACTSAIFVPCCQALGHFWSHVKVQMQKLPDGFDHKDDDLIV